MDPEIVHDAVLRTVTQLCHATYAYQVQNTQYQMEQMRQQQSILQKEYNNDLQNIQVLQERQSKLQHVLNIFHEMETIVQQNTGAKNGDSSITHQRQDENRLASTFEQLHAIQQWIVPLLEAFTLEERQQLQLSSTLLPTIIGTMVQTIFDPWDPFVRPHDYELSKTIFRNILLLGNNEDDATSTTTTTSTKSYDEDLYQIRHTLIRNYILPKFQWLYESSHWDPMNDDQEIGLNIYEWFIHILQHEINIDPTSSSTSNIDATTKSTTEDDNVRTDDVLFQTTETNESTGTVLANMVTKHLVHTVVYDKLLRVLNHNWKPKWDEQQGFVHRPDLWIIPWLPYIATDTSLMPTLVSDCKRAVKHAISYLHRTIPPTQNDVYIQICLQTLRGWIGILKMDSLHNIMSAASVVPRFAHYLSHCDIHTEETMESTTVTQTTNTNAPNHWKTALHTLFQYHQLKLLSDVQFLSLLEGELLPHWADTIYQYMYDNIALNETGNMKGTYDSKVIEIVCQVYVIWKSHIFGGSNKVPVVESHDVFAPMTPSHVLLRNDIPICECFYSVVRMVRTYYQILNGSTLNASETNSNDNKETISVDALRLSSQGYRTVYKRRNDRMKQQASDDLLRMNLSGMAGTTTSNGNGSNNNNNNNKTSSSVLEAQVRLHQAQSKDMFHNGHHGPSFRDVVAEFAREQDILFQPRLNVISGGGSSNNSTTTKDGKPIYLFGTIPLYLDHNVAYAYTNANTGTTTSTTKTRDWQPMSLNEIAVLAKQQASV